LFEKDKRLAGTLPLCANKQTMSRNGNNGNTGNGTGKRQNTHISRRQLHFQKKRRQELDNVPAPLRKPVLDQGDPAEYRRQLKAYAFAIDKMLCKKIAFGCWKIRLRFRKRVARRLLSNVAATHAGGAGPAGRAVAVPHWAEAGRFFVSYPYGQIIPIPDSPEPPEPQDSELQFSIADLNMLNKPVGNAINVPM
jgi:hypothetical protein